MKDIFLRTTDFMLAVLWLWVLVKSLRAARIGGQSGFQWNSNDRPFAYWCIIALLVLMVVHFAGLAVVGQLRPAG